MAELTADVLLVLAPGDEGRLEDAAPSLIARGFEDAGFQVLRFAFPACDSGDSEARDALVRDGIENAVACRLPHQALVLAGLSRGARVSVELAESLGAAAVVGFAYPFHPRHDPDPADRAQRLASLAVPVLICQGTRDSHGNRQQVRGYRLPSRLQLHWLEDANHALHPRPRSGHTRDEQLAFAVGVAVDFVREALREPRR